MTVSPFGDSVEKVSAVDISVTLVSVAWGVWELSLYAEAVALPCNITATYSSLKPPEAIDRCCTGLAHSLD